MYCFYCDEGFSKDFRPFANLIRVEIAYHIFFVVLQLVARFGLHIALLLLFSRLLWNKSVLFLFQSCYDGCYESRNAETHYASGVA